MPGKEGQLQVISRVIVLPDGTRIDLTHEAAVYSVVERYPLS